MSDHRMKWFEQQVGVAKLVLTLSFATCGSLIAWVVSTRATESDEVLRLAIMTFIGFAFIAIAAAVWIARALNKMGGRE